MMKKFNEGGPFATKSCGPAWGKGNAWHKASASTQILGLQWLSPAEGSKDLQIKMRSFLRRCSIQEIFGARQTLATNDFLKSLDKKGFKFVYQHMRALIEEMDENSDGVIDRRELELFLHPQCDEDQPTWATSPIASKKVHLGREYAHPALSRGNARALSAPVLDWKRAQTSQKKHLAAQARLHQKEHDHRQQARCRRDVRRHARFGKTNTLPTNPSIPTQCKENTVSESRQRIREAWLGRDGD
jgi:hypothetical protein